MTTEDESRRIAAALHQALATAARESAPIAWARAPNLCHHTASGEQPCLSYHRIWQYLALFGIGRSIRSDTEFLIEIFRRLAREADARRVLVSGTADYGMLAHVLWAYELEAIEPEVVVVDRCATPLLLNRWYAERVGARIETVEGDILDHRPAQAVDIVCTHSFLGWFTPPNMRRLARSWFEMLRPGGSVVTTRRLHESGDPLVPKRFDDDEVLAYGERVRRAAQEDVGPLPATPDEMARVAWNYARGYARYPAVSREALAEIFGAGGFPAVEITDGTPADAGANRPSGPLRQAGNRVRIVARRPD